MTSRIPYKALDLYHTLISGQTFEWNLDETDNSWHGVIYNHPVILRQIGNTQEGYLEYSYIDNEDRKEDIIQYFGLDEDYSSLINQISFDPYIRQTLTKLHGLRVIRQDPWYCINAFILSSNNTVHNIRNILKNISQLYIQSEPGSLFYPFPHYEQINSVTEKELILCKTGYRAEYLLNFYQKIAEEPEYIQNIATLSYTDAKNRLMEIKGIGEKVADCILLYGYGKYEAYPIDTHIRQATLECYFPNAEKKPSDKAIRQWAAEYWPGLAGFAHFFLFTYKRLYGSISLND